MTDRVSNQSIGFFSRNGTGCDCPVNSALRSNALRGLAQVTCEMQQGIATLHGKVSSYYLKQLAQEVVMKVEEVDTVVNRIKVCHASAG